MLNLERKVALVTGASRGIGKAIAIALENAGAHVVCISRTAKDVQAVADSLSNASCLLYTSPSPRDRTRSRMPSSA